jgi:hypothetical protein
MVKHSLEEAQRRIGMIDFQAGKEWGLISLTAAMDQLPQTPYELGLFIGVGNNVSLVQAAVIE